MERNDDIYFLVHKQLVGELSVEEGKSLSNLLLDNDNAIIASEVSKAWEQSASTTELKFDEQSAYNKFLNATTQPKVINIQSQPKKKFNLTYTLSAIAATFLIGFFALNIFTSNATTTHAYADGSMVTLADGSKVYLDENSSISFNSDFKVRQVDLTGKAMFEVAKNLGSTFTVVADKTEVTVLGTSFTVSSFGDNKEVKVLEGKVKVQQKNEYRILNDREGVSINNDVITEMEKVSFKDDLYFISNLIYDNAPISKVLSDMESKFNVSFNIKSKNDISKCLFTSKSLEDVALNDIISILKSTYNIEIKETNPSEFEILRLSCR